MIDALHWFCQPNTLLALGSWLVACLVIMSWLPVSRENPMTIPPPPRPDAMPTTDGGPVVSGGISSSTQTLIAQAAADAAAAQAAQAKAQATYQAVTDSLAGDLGMTPTMPTNELAMSLQSLQSAVNGHGATLDKILARLCNLEALGAKMASSLDALTAAVANNTTVTQSAITLIQGLKTQLDAAIAELPDPTALNALSAQMGTDDAALAAAITANTPSAPPPAAPAVPTAAKAPAKK